MNKEKQLLQLNIEDSSKNLITIEIFSIFSEKFIDPNQTFLVTKIPED